MNQNRDHFSIAQKRLFVAARLLEPPSGRWPKRRFKGAKVREALDGFIAALYALDWDDFREPRHFELAERIAVAMLSLIEYFVTAKYGSRDTSECAVFTERMGQLRAAIDGLREGLPPDPAKRPTREEIDAHAEAALFEVLKPSLPR